MTCAWDRWLLRLSGISPDMTLAIPHPVSVVRPTRRSWSFTFAASVALTAFTVLALLGSIALFVVLSMPVWRHEGLGYLTGTTWYFRDERFGSLPMFYGTAAVAAIALLLAGPMGIGAAVFTAEFLPPRLRLLVKLLIELLAGIPSVVYGLLGILFLRNYVYNGFRAVGLDPLSGDSLLTAGLLLAVMVLPTVMTLADDALRAVPAAQRQAARGLGLTRTQAVVSVALPQARKGLIAAVLLAFGRALGEMIAVFLVVGRQDNRWPAVAFADGPLAAVGETLVNAGQTLSSKLGGAETNIAYGDPLHWAAIVGLGLILMATVAVVTLVGAKLQPDGDAPAAGTTTAGRVRLAVAGGLVVAAGVAVVGVRPTAATAAAIGVIWLAGWAARWLFVSRRGAGAAFAGLTALAAAVSCGLLFGVVGAILFRGLPAVTWQFLTEQIRLVGASGGIFFNLVGTLILIATAAAVSAPTAVGLALAHSVYLPEGRRRRGLSLLLYTLNGVPSILFGILGLIVFVKFLGLGKSWLSGGALLGMMIVPTVTVALVERMKVLPARYVEAAYGLGLTQAQVVRSVILPQTAGGLVTGLMLGLARAAGETAPIMFTATIFAGAGLPTGVRDSPVLSLPYHIFILAQDSYDPRVGAKVWGTATVLLALVMALSAVALPLRLKAHEEARHA
jgi:phosphate transport system permease protein